MVFHQRDVIRKDAAGTKTQILAVKLDAKTLIVEYNDHYVKEIKNALMILTLMIVSLKMPMLLKI